MRTLALVAFALLLPACEGPSVDRAESGTVRVKTKAMTEVSITIKKDEVTIETRPIPIWETLIRGLTSAITSSLTKRSEDDVVSH